MSNWKIKSSTNLSAAIKLISFDYSSSSVHCSYYSCIQMMLHILGSHFMKSDAEISDESYKGGQASNGMHNWLIKIIFKEMTIANGSDAVKFNRYINNLKGIRVDSDYKNIEIKQGKAIQASEEAKETIKLLIRNFKV